MIIYCYHRSGCNSCVTVHLHVTILLSVILSSSPNNTHINLRSCSLYWDALETWTKGLISVFLKHKTALKFLRGVKYHLHHLLQFYSLLKWLEREKLRLQFTFIDSYLAKESWFQKQVKQLLPPDTFLIYVFRTGHL